MKLKQLSLMTMAALYASGVAAVTSETSVNQAYKKLSVQPFEMTNEQYNEIKVYNQLMANRQGLTAGPNSHIQRNAKGSDKVPFKFEDGLTGEHTYIVQLDEQPVASYQGGVNGLAATSPNANKLKGTSIRLNASSSATLDYVQHLDNEQQKVRMDIASVVGGQADILRSYKYAFNGMSMKLTQAQAAKAVKINGVRSVTRSSIRQLQTDVGPAHIGADKIWDGTVTANAEFTGAGIVVGIIDTGINSNHPSFAAQGDDGVAIINPLGEGNYLGDCAKEEFASMCNDKLIGIHSYSGITDSYGDPEYRDLGWWDTWERARPANGEDYNGHGSHTASTVAGNILYDVAFQFPELGYGEEITGRDTELVFPMVSGVAPHANIVAYQVCWAGGAEDPFSGCPEDVMLQAIDDAIVDGVDVINFSIGGQEEFPWNAPIELAFLAAREAGVSVAASAGNAGYSWMDHVSPWLTSVAASTHGRVLETGVKQLEAFEGGDSVPTSGSYSAASVTGAYTGPVVLAEHYDVNNANCDTEFAAGTFDLLPNGDPLVEDPIVVCGRSDQPRVTKSDNIKAGGAGGFILYNTQSDYLYGDSLAQKVDDFYSLPAAHVGNSHGGKIKTWLETGTGHRVTITDGSFYTATEGTDQLADFSSRGPSKTNPNIMAPTVSAPGVDVFAAYANDRIFTLNGSGQNWAMISGTSMASPHVAGAMALIQNAHPDWTPAEIQSALTTTTTPVYNKSNNVDTFDNGGAGVINVANAVQATLIMNESIENYQNANPLLGGDVAQLNTPYMVNRECMTSCTWYRTFTATDSGTWNVTGEEVQYDGASLMSFEISPTEFSLAAGESQRVMVTVSIPEVDFQSDSPLGAGNSDGYQFNGKLTVTPADAEKPMQILPVIAKVKRHALPVVVEATIGREKGELTTPSMLLPATSSVSANVYGGITGTIKENFLKQNTIFPWEIIDSLPTVESQIGYQLFTVPSGTKRIIVEVVDEPSIARHTSRIDLGRDINADGQINWQSETICVSDWRKRDYCAINNPEPGQYWYMITNMKYSNSAWWDPYDEAHKIVTSVVTINDEITTTINISATSSDGVTPTALELNWELPSLAEQDIIHAVVELGTDSVNADIGMIPVRLIAGQSDVSITSSHQGAKVGDIVEFEVIQQANLLGGDRDVDIQITLPEGLTLDPNNVRGNEFTNEVLSVEGNVVSISGTQPSSKNSPRRYEYTTNRDDAMCRLPFSDYPQFVDMPSIGVPQLPGFSSEWDQLFEIPDFVGYDSYFPHIPLYSVQAKDTDNIITIKGDGLLHFDAHAIFSLPGYSMSFDGLRDLVATPFWRANAVTLNESGMDFATFTPYERGVYAASLNQGQFLAVQWKEMFNVNPPSSPWGWPEIDRTTHFDFQMIASSDIDFTPGAYEIYFSYADMSEDKGEHTAGIKGYEGVRGFFYPTNGYNWNDYAVNEPEKVETGTIVCANYQGPESTRIVARFSAIVNANAAASTQDIMMSAQVTHGNTVEQAIHLNVVSNITVFDLADQMIAENTSIESINVEYLHSGNRAVGIEVTADHATVAVEGMSFSITPDANWYGESEVMVTVYDVANPNDKAMTSFMLTVESDGVELGCTDSSATNFDSMANTDNGSCTFPATETEPKKSSGGSFGWLMFGLLPLIFVRRKFS